MFTVLEEVSVKGSTTARAFIDLSDRVDRVIGHYLLTGDYQAIGQVVELPDVLIDKTIDIYEILLQAEYNRQPAIRSGRGLGLADLIRLNTGDVGLDGESPSLPAVTACQRTLDLWSALLDSGCVRSGRNQLAEALDEVTVARLRGETPLITGPQWRKERLGYPRAGARKLAWPRSQDAAIAALTTPLSTNTVEQIAAIHGTLMRNGMVDSSATYDLLATAAQKMAPKLNAELRTTSWEKLPKRLLEAYAIAVWEIDHLDALTAFYRACSRQHAAPMHQIRASIDAHRAAVRRVSRGEDPGLSETAVADLSAWLRLSS